jgi:hypothetical protein
MNELCFRCSFDTATEEENKRKDAEGGGRSKEAAEREMYDDVTVTEINLEIPP